MITCLSFPEINHFLSFLRSYPGCCWTKPNQMVNLNAVTVENISRALKPLQHFNYMLNWFFHRALAFQMKGLGPRADRICWCPGCRLCGQSLPVNHCLTYLTIFHSYNNYFIWPFVDHCHLPHILAQEKPITGIVFPPTRKCLALWRLTDSWLELYPPSQSSITIVL